jgi:DnaJ-class molecular chaperone
VSVSFIESLCGWTRAVPTVDGKRVQVSPFKPTGPNWREVFPELGMPDSQEPSKRGDLIVAVNIEYPPGPFSYEQGEALKKIIEGPPARFDPDYWPKKVQEPTWASLNEHFDQESHIPSKPSTPRVQDRNRTSQPKYQATAEDAPDSGDDEEEV